MEKYNINKPESIPEILHFKTHEGHVQIEIDRIKYCHAYGPGPYTLIYDDLGKTYSICQTLKEVEDILTGNCFCRCHYSWFININHTDFFCSSKKLVIMKDHLYIPISRSKWQDALTKFLFYGIQDKRLKTK